MKKFVGLLLALCLSVSTVALTGCKPKVSDTEQTLEVFVLDAGYGSQWCRDLLDLFKEQDWVKEKYPDLQIVFSHNDVTSYGASKLEAGARSNTIDLFCDAFTQEYGGPNGQLENLTESVYNSTVPGETVKWIEKATPSYTVSNRYIDVANPDAEDSWYVTSWASGMCGILYNESMLTRYGLDVPRTTNELLDVCAALKTHGKYSFVQSKDETYWAYLHDIWWAQYEGISRYIDFWNGVDNGEYSVDIFKQRGKEETLKVYEDLLKYSKGYLNPSSFTYGFMQAQTLFLQGETAAFNVNGDWFDNEMRSIYNEIKAENNGEIDTFKMMRTPIVSALGTKLGIDDATLSALVAYVDGEGEKPTVTSTKNYTEAQIIEAVKEARTVVYSIGPNHKCCIPKYANGKQVAIDFLRFMATDIAQEQYIKTTGGAMLPFNYNVKEKNPTLYNSLSDLQKSRLDYFFADTYDVYTLPAVYSFPLARYGELTANISERYYETFSANGNTKTAHDFYQETIDNWTESKWNMALVRAGISA